MYKLQCGERYSPRTVFAGTLFLMTWTGRLCSRGSSVDSGHYGSAPSTGVRENSTQEIAHVLGVPGDIIHRKLRIQADDA